MTVAQTMTVGAVLVAVPLVFLGPDLYAALRAGRPAWRHLPRLVWTRIWWRRLSHSLGLSLRDDFRAHEAAPLQLVKSGWFGFGSLHAGRHSHRRARLRAPKLRLRVDPYGWTGTIRTVPGTGLLELMRAAPYLADAWGCVRVEIGPDKPGRVRVRALKRDPLLEPYTVDAGTLAPADLARVHVGRDEFFRERHVSVANASGIAIAGLPGFGKTSLLRYWLARWALSPAVAFVIVDGKAAGDYDGFARRAARVAGDDLDQALEALNYAHNEMRRRHRLARRYTQGRSANLWSIGPSPELPLLVVVIDECHTFLSPDGRAKEDREKVAGITGLVEQLAKKGRSAMVLTVVATQKQTSDAVPTRIRDVCGLSLAFACRTRDAAVAALGEAVRESTVSPVDLTHEAYVGVAVALLSGGAADLVRVRVPWLAEDAPDVLSDFIPGPPVTGLEPVSDNAAGGAA